MRYRIVITVLLTILCPMSPVASDDQGKDIKLKQIELEQLQSEITQFEERIKSTEQREQNTLEMLDTYDRQSTLIKKLLRTLHVQERKLQDDISGVESQISHLEKQVSFLQEHYARYVVGAYKHGQLSDLELVLSSRSLNEFAIRIEYLQRFSDQRKKDLQRLNSKKDLLREKIDLLAEKLDEEQHLITVKSSEEENLSKKSEERKVLLDVIRKDKKNYRREIDRKMRAAKELEKFIADLIEQDRIRREHEATTPSDKTVTIPPTSPGTAFDLQQGKLRWPVAVHARIASRFGNQIHPQLKTVTQNTGVDISVPNGTDVLSVAEGEIALISWLPSYGNLVIVNHGNGYRTVYTHLAEIVVTTGEKVTEGQTIGSSGDSLSGPMVHFELWHEREKQDPELWLKRR
jgi:septal ring factor EnvC (AmiA/AmiB activator)